MRFGLSVMVCLAVGVALYSVRYYGVPLHVWLGVDDGIRGVIMTVPLQALTHMLVGPIALLLGPWQFLPRLRAAFPRFHRLSGRVYVAACVIAGLGGLATTPYASGGPVAGIGFAILALAWVGTTLAAWRAAVRRNFALHRLLMRFSFAMTFAAVTLRLQIPLGFLLGYHSYSAMSVWLAYSSWIPNVAVVALYSWLVSEPVRSGVAARLQDGGATGLPGSF